MPLAELGPEPEIADYYIGLRKFVRRTAKGFFDCCFLHGKAGLGKSFQVEAELERLGFMLNEEKKLSEEKNKRHFIIFSGEMSHAYLYRYLYEHNGKVVVFRDMEKRLNCLDSINIFRAATETHGPRKVRKANYSKHQKDLPESFCCKSRFIFEMNSLNFKWKLKEEIESLIDSRGNYKNIMFSRDDIERIMRLIAKTKIEKEITEFLLSNFQFVGWNRFDLRTQNKAFKIYKCAKSEGTDWKIELQEYLESETRIRQQLYPYIGSNKIKSIDLKRLLVKAKIDNCYTMRTADRRIRDYVLLQELFIAELGETSDEEEIEGYMNAHRKYSLCLDPPMARLSDTNDTETSAPQQEIAIIQELAT